MVGVCVQKPSGFKTYEDPKCDGIRLCRANWFLVNCVTYSLNFTWTPQREWVSVNGLHFKEILSVQSQRWRSASDPASASPGRLVAVFTISRGSRCAECVLKNMRPIRLKVAGCSPVAFRVQNLSRRVPEESLQENFASKSNWPNCRWRIRRDVGRGTARGENSPGVLTGMNLRIYGEIYRRFESYC